MEENELIELINKENNSNEEETLINEFFSSLLQVIQSFILALPRSR